MKVMQFVKQAVKEIDGRKIFTAIASTPHLDRDGDVLLPQGCIYERFMENPVMLAIHNFHATPVGKVLKLDISDQAVMIDFVFTETEAGKEYEGLYEKGDMNAFSVSFIASATPIEINKDQKGSVDVEVADGSIVKVNLDSYEKNPWRIFGMWELLEVSPVTVPSNAYALLVREMAAARKKAIASHGMIAKSFIESDFEVLEADLRSLMEKLQGDITEYKLKGSIAVHTTPVIEATWSGSSAISELAKWASEDASGDKDTINWADFARGFAWFNEAEVGNFAAYQLTHHTLEDGKLVAVWKGITSAMGTLLGKDSGDIPEEDRPSVYTHLAAHYRDFDKEPPEFEKTYTEGELAKIMEGENPDSVTQSQSGVRDAGHSGGDNAGCSCGGTGGSINPEKLTESVKDITERLIQLGIKSDVLFDMMQAALGKAKGKKPKTLEPTVEVGAKLWGDIQALGKAPEDN